MNKSILFLCAVSLAGLVLVGCANRSEVSYEIPPHRGTPQTAGSTTGVDPNPGPNAGAVGPLVNPGR